MQHILISSLASAIIILLIVITQRWHHFSADHDFSSPQKFHQKAVPRIGGLALMAALAIILAYAYFKNFSYAPLLAQLLIAGQAVFWVGILEDLTKKISPKTRLFASVISALAAIWLAKAIILRTDTFIDDITPIPLFIFYALTLFAVAGLVNAINIIDGFNGLAGASSAVMCASIAYIAWQSHDPEILLISLSLLGALFGFLLWNYPFGLIFLGDGGAYFLGFLLSELTILLILRNDDISAWYPILLFSYPIVETIFSIYRKKFIRGMSPAVPDGVHLHMLIYKRVLRGLAHNLNLNSNQNGSGLFSAPANYSYHLHRRQRFLLKKNALTSPYLWLLTSLAVVPATLFYNNTLILQAFFALFMVSYWLIYWRIVRFKTPKRFIKKIKY